MLIVQLLRELNEMLPFLLHFYFVASRTLIMEQPVALVVPIISVLKKDNIPNL
jgi:hypothetical protein